MFKQKRNYLFIAAIAGLILVIALVIAGTAGRNAMLNETGETRQVVEAALMQFLPDTAISSSASPCGDTFTTRPLPQRVT